MLPNCFAFIAFVFLGFMSIPFADAAHPRSNLAFCGGERHIFHFDVGVLAAHSHREGKLKPAPTNNECQGFSDPSGLRTRK